ncbi:MAG: HEPN domain-containing protein [Candidatus Aegiribacteria sp.]|nr:HEPN domain-containing protein [Candidatus Aegiribacteria sp.]
MSLEKWAENGWLKTAEPDGGDIESLLSVAVRNIRDSRVKGLSDDSVFMLAYQAILSCACALLLTKGFRPASKGQHYYSIESLRETLGNDEQVDVLQQIRNKRNIIQYEQAGIVSPSEALRILELTDEIFTSTKEILRSHIKPDAGE